jgi:hypothetical protein
MLATGAPFARRCGETFMASRRRWLRSLGLVVFALLATGAYAQLTEGSISGKVMDPSGATVAGAKVTASNTETGFTTNQTTDNIGYFRLSHLAPGKYQLQIEAPGFQTTVVKDVTVNVNTVTPLQISVALGSVQQSVTVTEAVALVQTEEGRLSDTISTREVTDLPLNGRQVYSL